MELCTTEKIKALLQEVASCSAAEEELKSEAQRLQDADAVPWDLLKKAAKCLREQNPGKEYLLSEITRGSDLHLPKPRAKPPNPELEARRVQLRAQLEDLQYSQMVSDITKKEREAADLKEMLPTSQSQFSFGAHVLVTMFTLFALGYWGSKQWLGVDELWAGLLGSLGLGCGLIMETVLLIIRTNRPKPLEERFPHLFDPKVYNNSKSRAASRAGQASSSSSTIASSSSGNARLRRTGAGQDASSSQEASTSTSTAGKKTD